MKKTLFQLSLVGIMVLGLLSLGGQSTEAKSISKEELSSTEKQKTIQLLEEYFGPLKRSATEEEIKLINETIEGKLKADNDFEMEEVLKELGLEDVGYLEPDNPVSEQNSDSDTYKYGDANTLALNVGSMGFRNPSHTSTHLRASLLFTNIGFTKLDSFNGMITPYTKTSGGAWVQNGEFEYIAETQLIVGTTVFGDYSAPHNNQGARLVAAGVIVDKGKGTVLNPASVTYEVK